MATTSDFYAGVFVILFVVLLLDDNRGSDRAGIKWCAIGGAVLTAIAFGMSWILSSVLPWILSLILSLILWVIPDASTFWERLVADFEQSEPKKLLGILGVVIACAVGLVIATKFSDWVLGEDKGDSKTGDEK